MNRAEMRTQTRILLGETVGDGYTDTEINSVLNTSCLLVARDVLSLKTHRDISLVAWDDPLLTDPEDPRKVGRYSLPDDMLAMIAVKIWDGSRWLPMTKMENEEYDATALVPQGGPPTHYKLEFGAVSLTSPKAGDISLWPYPDGEYTLRRIFMQKPTPMSDDSHTSELPEVAHFCACCHSALVLSRKFKDRVLMGEMADLYETEKIRVQQWANRQDSTGPQFMRSRG